MPQIQGLESLEHAQAKSEPGQAVGMNIPSLLPNRRLDRKHPVFPQAANQWRNKVSLGPDIGVEKDQRIRFRHTDP